MSLLSPDDTLPNDFKALVIGSTGALGQALIEGLKREPRCAQVLGVARSLAPGFDLEDPPSLERLARHLAPQGPFHLIIDATGALTIDGVGPEKALSMLDAQALQRAFAVNTIGPALLLRHLAPLMARGDAIYAKLSARVGSIADNRKGGWYGYRASKAAMNMVLQTAAIELQRRHPRLRVVALQPGTVRSRLSQPFQAGVPRLLEPSESAAGLLACLLRLPVKPGAQFMDHLGQEIPW
jgi:NAD(P)-dependent dehydrogenase (short-subunit alcohol dehydrogenase family)